MFPPLSFPPPVPRANLDPPLFRKPGDGILSPTGRSKVQLHDARVYFEFRRVGWLHDGERTRWLLPEDEILKPLNDAARSWRALRVAA